MRIQKHVLVILILFASLFLAACSEKKESDVSTDSDNKGELTQPEEEKESEEKETASLEELISALPEPSTTAEEIIHAAAGQYSGKRYSDLTPEQQTEIIDVFKQLPKLGEKPTEQEIDLYWRTALSLFHEDFPDPANALHEVDVEAFGSPDIEDERFHFKEQLNVEIILDASGSMGNFIDGKTMMDIAKESITEFAASLPEGANIALRVYGHKGTGSDKDKELSCSSNELIYEMQGYDQGALDQALSGIKPAGWTPLANAIELAKNDLSQYDSESNTNIVYLVSDGIETCNGDPVVKAKELAESNIQPIVNVIGFDLDAKGQQQLKDVAEAAKGIYNNARNQEELKQELQKAKRIAEKWQEWKKTATYTVKMNRNEQFLKNIPSFNVEWREKNWNENANIPAALDALVEEGHISREAYKLLYNLADERMKAVSEFGNQIDTDLQNIADQNLENAEEEINKKYKSNVENQS